LKTGRVRSRGSTTERDRPFVFLQPETAKAEI